jgi:hypothetical protein
MQLPEAFFGELVPAKELPQEPISAYEARAQADARDEPVTSKQFDAFRASGLVVPRADGRYEPMVINQLVAIKRTAAYARPLARRTVFLRGNFLLFPVPPEKLVQALVALVPLVDRPARKIARIARSGLSSEATRDRSRRPPPVAEWVELIDQATPGLIGMWAAGWYAMATAAIPAHYLPARSPLDDIRLEEQVLCLAVLDLDRRARTREVP